MKYTNMYKDIDSFYNYPKTANVPNPGYGLPGLVDKPLMYFPYSFSKLKSKKSKNRKSKNRKSRSKSKSRSKKSRKSKK